MIRKSNFNTKPSIQMPDHYDCTTGWEDIVSRIKRDLQSIRKEKKVLVIECYHGVYESELYNHFKQLLNPVLFIHASDHMLPDKEIEQLVFPDVTDDRIFGVITRLEIGNYFGKATIEKLQGNIRNVEKGVVIIMGVGASIIQPFWDLLIYADMPRWELQQRMRRGTVDNIGLKNKHIDPARLYKQGFFVDWRICDRQKRRLMKQWDYVLDSTQENEPALLAGSTYLNCLAHTVTRPFSVVPFFDPGPWGGQWMKEVCNLDQNIMNYAWCFNCVPEENSLLFQFGEKFFETPAINLVFDQPESLLGPKIYQRFGAEFPIRFDFLDTMKGGNLSLQVHPITSYIRDQFGMAYTQDESYYFLDAESDAIAYLGLKEGINRVKMFEELREAQNGGRPFEADRYVEAWPIKKHDHLLIPAGTIHCQGKNSMVLEISATPYIFTFKLWDWGRIGLDGKPRPINIDHGEQVIQWERDTAWTKNNLINRVEKIAEGDGWREERTGLHELEFIETRRHWFATKVEHHTWNTVNVLNLVEGREAVVESPDGTFSPFIVHYAETFILPAAVGRYTIRPYGESIGKELATVKAYVKD